MEIVRLANTSWLDIPDWRVFALRAMWTPHDPACDPTPTWLPMLDWPTTLFPDEQVGP